MSQNRLGIATVVLLVLLGLTVWRMNAREAEVKAPAKLEAKLPKLERDKLDQIELSSPDKPKVRLVKKGSEWRLAEPLDARADQDAVKSALDKLAELEVTGVAATQPSNHERLEVDEKKGTHVIARADGKVMLDGWIGSYQSGNSMFRLQGQDLVATVKGSIRYAFSKPVREWRDRTIDKLESKDVREIVFENKNGRFDFVRSGEDWNQVVDKHDKRDKRIDPLDQGKLKSIVGTATSLTAADFAEPSVTPEQAGLGAGAATVALKLANDAGAQQILYRIGNEKDQNYYLQREGNATLFMVAKWTGERLISGPDAFLKKEAPAANAAPVGSPQNPIPVEPVGHQVLSPAQVAAREAMAKAATSKPPTVSVKPATPPPPAKKQ
jgi:hypothetical protein